MYQIQLNYAYPLFNQFDIIMNDITLTTVAIDKTAIIQVPYQSNTLQVKNKIMTSSTIEVKDGDVIFITIHPIIWIIWAIFIVLLFLGHINFSQLFINLLVTWQCGLKLKVAPRYKEPQLTF